MFRLIAITATAIFFLLAQSSFFVAGEDELCVGNEFGCYLVGGRPFCWGSYTAFGGIQEEPGDNEVADQAGEKAQPTAITGIKKIYCGFRTLFAITDAGEVLCLGDNQEQQCALGGNFRSNFLTSSQLLLKGYTKQNITAKLLSAENKTAGIVTTKIGVSTNDRFACYLFSNGKVKCMGYCDNQYCARAYGSIPTSSIEGEIPWVQYDGADLLAKDIACGSQHCCVLTATGNKVVCWGVGKWLGIGAKSNSGFGPTAVNLVNNTDNPTMPTCTTIKQMSVFGYNTCVLCQDNRPRCWGRNYNAQAYNDKYFSTSRGNTYYYIGDDANEMNETTVPPPNDLGTGLNISKIRVVDDGICYQTTPGNRWKCPGSANTVGSPISTISYTGDQLAFLNAGQFNATIVDIVGGRRVTCFTTATVGDVRCFGRRTFTGTSDAFNNADSVIGDQSVEMTTLKKVDFGATLFGSGMQPMCSVCVALVCFVMGVAF